MAEIFNFSNTSSRVNYLLILLFAAIFIFLSDESFTVLVIILYSAIANVYAVMNTSPSKTPPSLINNGKIPTITEGFVTSVDRYNNILIGPMLPRIYDNSPKILLIYAIYPKLTRITAYPIENDYIWKISLFFTSDDPTIFSMGMEKFIRFHLIHTTGLSEKENGFAAEYYINENLSLEQVEIMEKEFLEIKGIANCSIIPIKPE